MQIHHRGVQLSLKQAVAQGKANLVFTLAFCCDVFDEVRLIWSSFWLSAEAGQPSGTALAAAVIACSCTIITRQAFEAFSSSREQA